MTPRERALLEDAAELAGWGETLAAAAMRMHRSEGALVQALRRCGPGGLGVIDRLRANEPDGHVHQATLRRWAS